MTSAILDLAFLMPNMKDGSQLSVGRVFTNPSNTLTFESHIFRVTMPSAVQFARTLVHLFRYDHSVLFHVFCPFICLFVAEVSCLISGSLSVTPWARMYCGMSNTALLAVCSPTPVACTSKDIFGLLGRGWYPSPEVSICLWLSPVPFSPPPLTCAMKPNGSFAARLTTSIASHYSSISSENGVRSFQPLFVKHQMLPHGTWQHLVEIDVLPDFSSTFPIFQKPAVAWCSFACCFHCRQMESRFARRRMRVQQSAHQTHSSFAQSLPSTELAILAIRCRVHLI